MRRFCWQEPSGGRVYDNGYLGALPEHGFAAPLLAQIAEELRADLSAPSSGRIRCAISGPSNMTASLNGINIHADFAAVNVNFWITPDEANLDPRTRRPGGVGRGGAAGLGF